MKQEGLVVRTYPQCCGKQLLRHFKPNVKELRSEDLFDYRDPLEEEKEREATVGRGSGKAQVDGS